MKVPTKCVLTFLCFLAVGNGSAPGQMAGGMRSLGGYGEATIGSYYQSNPQGPLIPMAGGSGGFVPYRGLESREPVASAMVPRRIEPTPIGGRGMAATPIGGASRMRGGLLSPTGLLGGMGLLGRPAKMNRFDRGVMPPRIGSPFRQPPSLNNGGSSGSGMGAM